MLHIIVISSRFLKFGLRKYGCREKVAPRLCGVSKLCAFIWIKMAIKCFLGTVSQELLEFKVNIISNSDCETWLKRNISSKRLVDFQGIK